MEPNIILTSFFIAAVTGLLVKNRKAIEIVSIIASLLGLVETVSVSLKVASSGSYTPIPLFSIDAIGAIVMLIIAFVGFMATFYSVWYLRIETNKNIIGISRVKQYFLLFNFFLLAMFLAIMSSSPILSWIAIEATTLSTALLISFYNKPSAIEAAWKYLIINSLGLLFGFFGSLLYFTALGPTSKNGIVSWQTLTTNAIYLDPLIAKIAFVFVLIGFGTKVGFVPMHTWLPDAHSKAPAPVSALLSGVLLNIAFVIILRFKNLTDVAAGQIFSQNLLILFGLFSVIVAALIMLTQQNYKRLLAYSSIENMGIIALGFGFGSIGIFASILHMIYHALFKSALFLSAGTIFLKYSSTKIAKVTGILTVLPVTSILFLTGFFAITGAPPFGIFLTKVFILSAGIKSHPGVSISILLLMAVVFIGFFKHVTTMFFGEKPAEIRAGEVNIWLIIPPLTLIAVAALLSFYIPPFLDTLIKTAVSNY